MSSIADRKKAKRLLAALGLPPGRANVVVRSDGKLVVRLTPEAKVKVRPTRFEGSEIVYENRGVPKVTGRQG